MIYEEKYDIENGKREEKVKRVEKGKSKQKFLGEGSYGCVIKPGYDCYGKTNNSKRAVTKITEINFASKNELDISEIIKNIKFNNKKIYYYHFVPIIKKCIVKYNILKNFEMNKCTNFLDNLNDPFDFNNNLLKKEFFLFTLKYINGLKIKKYLLGKNFNDEYYSNLNAIDNVNNSFNEYKIFVNNYINSYYYLLKSITLMQENNIIHNDLYNRNIIFDFKNNKPLVIDFGLSYNKNKFYKNVNKQTIDIKYINKFIFHYKEQHFDYNSEKRFVSFIIDNEEHYFTNKVLKSYQKNELTKHIIDFFINDIINTIKKTNFVNFIFENNEFDYYKKSLEKFYYKFLDKKKYDTYFKIVKELLPSVFEYTDLFSLTLEYIEILFYYKNNDNFNKKNSNGLLYVLIQLFKIIILPDTDQKINSQQMIYIIKFIMNKINTCVINSDFNNEIILQEFYNEVKKHNINVELFNNKEYAYFDFKKDLFDIDIIKDIKQLNIKLYKFDY